MRFHRCRGPEGPRVTRSTGSLARDALWLDLVQLMRAGVRTGRIVTTERTDRDRRSGAPTRQDSHYGYRRDGLPCRRCGTEVRRQVMAACNLCWCPSCQADQKTKGAYGVGAGQENACDAAASVPGRISVT